MTFSRQTRVQGTVRPGLPWRQPRSRCQRRAGRQPSVAARLGSRDLRLCQGARRYSRTTPGPTAGSGWHHRGQDCQAAALSRPWGGPATRFAVGRPGKQWQRARPALAASTSTRLDASGRGQAGNPALPDVIPGGAPNIPMGVAAMTLSRRVRHPRYQPARRAVVGTQVVVTR
jgi:hypothetical protein